MSLLQAPVRHSRGGVTLFTYAQGLDHVYVALSCIFHVLRGAVAPVNNLLIGSAVTKIGEGDLASFGSVVNAFAIVAVAGLFVGGLGAFMSEYSAEAQIARLKAAYLRSILRQEIGYFDTVDTGELSAGLEQACVKIREGIGYKFAMIFFCVADFVIGYVIALIYSWKLTLVMSAVLPLTVASLVVFEKILEVMSERGDKLIKYANTVVEEAIPAIRTIASFGLEEKFYERFRERIVKAEKVDVRANTYLSAVGSFMVSAPFFSFALGLWYASRLVRDAMVASDGTDMNTGGHVVTTYNCVIGSSQSLGMIFTFISGVAKANGALRQIKLMTDRQPEIDITEDGETPDSLDGSITFKNVRFAYPNRVDRQIFANVDFKIEAGEVVALVGPSGCGKSTIIQLIQRFYNPQGGSIEIDGLDIKRLSLKWLRSQMALVSQEPKLFCDTIENNIRCGYLGDPADIGFERIVEVSKQANADGFINNLSQKYKTNAGLGGSLLSGGQKQRIAIARAILRNPKILILDEATSALDNESEKIVQQALDELVKSKRRTTLIIAHRLSTIRAADKIVVFDNRDGLGSQVVEFGTHDELVQVENGIYRKLVEAQTIISAGSETKVAELQQELTKAMAVDTYAAERGQNELVSPGTHTAAATGRILPALFQSRSATKNSLNMATEKDLRLRSFDRVGSNMWVDETGRLSRQASSYRQMSLVRLEEKAEALPPPLLRDTQFDVLRSPKIRKLFSRMKKDWHLILIGCIGAAGAGCGYPAIATVLAYFTGIFYKYDPLLTAEDNGTNLMKSAHTGGLIILGISIASVVFTWIQWEGWGRAAEYVVYDLRRELFAKLLYQDMEYFDDPLNNTGRLSSIIVADSGLTRGVTGANGALLTQNLVTLIASIVLAYFGDWKLASVSLVVYLLIVPAFYFQMRFTTAIRSSVTDGALAQETPEFYLNECVTNLRTIAAYGLQDLMISKYDKALLVERQRGSHNAKITGISVGFAVSLTSAANCIAFFYASKLLQDASGDSSGRLSLQNVMQTIFVAMSAGTAMANSLLWTTDIKKAKAACINIFCVLERPTLQDSRDDNGDKTSVITGESQFKSIVFRYPHRPNHPVLGGVTFEVKAGQSIALVGASGSGKSTIIQLLQRFYDLQASDDLRIQFRKGLEAMESQELNRLMSASEFYGGEVLLDKKSIYQYNLRHLRSQMGLVGQEPVLFEMSVRENIANGRLGCSDEAVIGAAKKAHAHDFIMALPDGYDTNVGKGGGQMSGGQKQRIALARALVREPNILLLDEATSALDPQSEKIVQQTIDQVLKSDDRKTTTIMIAHRLSTVRNADKIVVFAPQPSCGSVIVEEGTHDELMKVENGVYLNLVKLSEGTANPAL